MISGRTCGAWASLWYVAHIRINLVLAVVCALRVSSVHVHVVYSRIASYTCIYAVHVYIHVLVSVVYSSITHCSVHRLKWRRVSFHMASGTRRSNS